MSMGLLVGHFRELAVLRNDASVASAPVQEENFSPELIDLRERLGHHLIPLALLARSDGKFAEAERNVIIEHCERLCGLDAEERGMLDDYLRQSRPALTQLDSALHRLEAESSSNINNLIDAAERLIRADGHIDEAEQRLLDRMRAELARNE